MKRQQPEPDKKEYTLIIGEFFDGIGNNEINTEQARKNCAVVITSTEAASILKQYNINQKGIADADATSYTGGFTNIHWLNKLYLDVVSEKKQHIVTVIKTDAGSHQYQGAAVICLLKMNVILIPLFCENSIWLTGWLNTEQILITEMVQVSIWLKKSMM